MSSTSRLRTRRSRWHLVMAVLTACTTLALFGLVACVDPVIPGNPNDFCQTATDCKAGQGCLNQICVTKSETTLPWSEVPTHGDAGQPDVPQPVCQNGLTRPCQGELKGACTTGNEVCEGGKWSECNVKPTDEVCDGVDNDCDGEVDEQPTDLDGECSTRLNGPCAKGKWSCEQGQRLCVSTYEKREEVCDGIDNDCDGNIDENTPGEGDSCVVQGQRGPCAGGIKRCAKGRMICQQVYQRKPEQCDGIDNNCDGATDEGCDCKPGVQEPCYNGALGCKRDDKGVFSCQRPCKFGTRVCSHKGKWGECVGEKLPSIETCDGKDNDCDGKADEGLQQACYTGPPGSQGKGVCRTGVRLCENGVWTKCQKQELPKRETCDGKDNDCDGDIDENLKQRCGKGVGICVFGEEVCKNGKWTGCTSPPALSLDIPCNGKDDNCDGNVDETKSNKDICNGFDDDCDGLVDENCGPSHHYALVAANGASSKKSGFISTSQVGQSGEYILKPTTTSPTGQRCANAPPLLLTPHSSKAAVATYACDPNTGSYRVFTFGDASARLKPEPTLKAMPLPFHAVTPTKGSFGVVQCNPTQAFSNGQYCRVVSSNSSLSVSFSTNRKVAVIKIPHPACMEGFQPIFATIYGNSPGYVRVLPVRSGSGLCEFQTFNKDGEPQLRSFSFWIPSWRDAAWVHINRDGSIGRQASNVTSAIEARWSRSRSIASTLFQYDALTYTDWTKPSAVLLSARFRDFVSTTAAAAMSFTLPSTGSNLRIYNHRKSSQFATHRSWGPDFGYSVWLVRTK